jgi:hypothetical protein
MTFMNDEDDLMQEKTLQENGFSPVAEAVVNKRQQAAELRAWSSHLKHMTPEAADMQADRMDAEADMLSDITAYSTTPVVVGTGGEITPDASSPGSNFSDTMQGRPSAMAVDASHHRVSLAKAAGVGAMALDAAESIQAKNSLEKMMAHQVAATHAAAMQVLSEGLALIDDFKKTGRNSAVLTTEAVRLLNVSTRLIESTQRGAMTLHRLRHSGRQTMVVQHVTVGEGGQAVVAGQMKNRGRPRRTGRGDDKK